MQGLINSFTYFRFTEQSQLAAHVAQHLSSNLGTRVAVGSSQRSKPEGLVTSRKRQMVKEVATEETAGPSSAKVARVDSPAAAVVPPAPLICHICNFQYNSKTLLNNRFV